MSSDDGGRRLHSRQSYCSTVSSEGNLSEEENTSEVSGRENGLLSTNSSENLQVELSKCYTMDGLTSDGDFKCSRKQPRASPQRSLEVCTLKYVTCIFAVLFIQRIQKFFDHLLVFFLSVFF